MCIVQRYFNRFEVEQARDLPEEAKIRLARDIKAYLDGAMTNPPTKKELSAIKRSDRRRKMSERRGYWEDVVDNVKQACRNFFEVIADIRRDITYRLLLRRRRRQRTKF